MAVAPGAIGSSLSFIHLLIILTVTRFPRIIFMFLKNMCNFPQLIVVTFLVGRVEDGGGGGGGGGDNNYHTVLATFDAPEENSLLKTSCNKLYFPIMSSALSKRTQ